MIDKMHRVEVVGPKSLTSEIVDAIQEVGVLHLEPIPLSEYGEKQFLHRYRLSPNQAQEHETVEELVSVLEESIGLISDSERPNDRSTAAYASRYAEWTEKDIGALSVAARSAHAKIRSYVRRRRNILDDLHALEAYEDMVAALAPLVESEELPKGYEFVGIVLDARNRKIRELFEEELNKLTNGEYRYVEAPASQRRVSALVGVSERHTHELRQLVMDSGIGQVTVPRYLRDRPFEQAIAKMEEDLKVPKGKLRAIEEQASAYYREQGADLLALLDVCRDKLARLEAISNIAVTEYTFVVWGWVPDQYLASLKERLAVVSNNTVVFREIEAGGKENPPVVLRNSKPVKQFEPLLGLFPLPKYGTIDPTGLVASIFPPVFGLMLADIAYGIILAIGAAIMYLRGRKGTLLRQIAFVVAACSFFTIVFGAVFGEFLGELGHHWFGLEPLWRERFNFTATNKAETLLGYMEIALAIGVLHVILGLLLGAVNARRTKNRSMFLESLARVVGVITLIVLVGRLASVLPPMFTTVGIVTAVVFLAIMIGLTIRSPMHGLMLPLEVLGTMGNILSYVRIMAIGLVSVTLAFLANMFGGIVGNAALAVVIAALVHILNLALGVIDPTIQGLRLQYVEFFSKFFIGGGTTYSPFRKSGGVS